MTSASEDPNETAGQSVGKPISLLQIAMPLMVGNTTTQLIRLHTYIRQLENKLNQVIDLLNSSPDTTPKINNKAQSSAQGKE